jgi:putative sigma-54 modulation protein
MRIEFTFRNLESSEGLKQYATDKLQKLQKYIRAPLDVAVTFSVERHLHCADVNLNSHGESYQGREESEDMYASIDVVADKIRSQLIRSKEQYEGRRRTAPVSDAPGE